MTHPTDDFALVVYATEDEGRPQARRGARPQPRPHDEAGGDERRIVPPSSRKAYMEVLRTNWFHLKSDEYLVSPSMRASRLRPSIWVLRGPGNWARLYGSFTCTQKHCAFFYFSM